MFSFGLHMKWVWGAISNNTCPVDIHFNCILIQKHVVRSLDTRILYVAKATRITNMQGITNKRIINNQTMIYLQGPSEMRGQVGFEFERAEFKGNTGYVTYGADWSPVVLDRTWFNQSKICSISNNKATNVKNNFNRWPILKRHLFMFILSHNDLDLSPRFLPRFYGSIYGHLWKYSSPRSSIVWSYPFWCVPLRYYPLWLSMIRYSHCTVWSSNLWSC